MLLEQDSFLITIFIVISFIQINPYLLGQIGLVGNLVFAGIGPVVTSPYLLGQIGLVGNTTKLEAIAIESINLTY